MATLNLGRIKPVFKGAYSGGTAYVIDDIVTSGGSSYICIQAHGAGTQAVTVTAYWSVLAATGTDVGATITTQGDILYRDGSGVQRLAKPASDLFLQNTSGGVLSWAAAGGGKVGQVLTIQNDLVESTTSTSFATIADLSIAITPSATTSKIMTFSSLTCSMENNHTNFRLMRDSTPIGIGAANGSRARSSFSIYETTSGQYSAWVQTFNWLDSPATASAVTYSWQWKVNGDTSYINRGDDDSDTFNYPRTPSTITVMEILA